MPPLVARWKALLPDQALRLAPELILEPADVEHARPEEQHRGEHLYRDRDHSAQAPAAQAVVAVAPTDQPRRKLSRDHGERQGTADHAKRGKDPVAEQAEEGT